VAIFTRHRARCRAATSWSGRHGRGVQSARYAARRHRRGLRLPAANQTLTVRVGSAPLNARRIAQFAAESRTCSSGSFASFHAFLLMAYWTPRSVENGSLRTSRMNGSHASESGARRLAARTWEYPTRMSDGVTNLPLPLRHDLLKATLLLVDTLFALWSVSRDSSARPINLVAVPISVVDLVRSQQAYVP